MSDHPNDITRRCKAVLVYWLQKNSNATWHDLVLTLRELELNYVAEVIEERFSGMFMKCTVLLSCSYIASRLFNITDARGFYQ